jgi:hypothetical protein
MKAIRVIRVIKVIRIFSCSPGPCRRSGLVGTGRSWRRPAPSRTRLSSSGSLVGQSRCCMCRSRTRGSRIFPRRTESDPAGRRSTWCYQPPRCRCRWSSWSTPADPSRSRRSRSRTWSRKLARTGCWLSLTRIVCRCLRRSCLHKCPGRSRYTIERRPPFWTYLRVGLE